MLNIDLVSGRWSGREIASRSGDELPSQSTYIFSADQEPVLLLSSVGFDRTGVAGRGARDLVPKVRLGNAESNATPRRTGTLARLRWITSITTGECGLRLLSGLLKKDHMLPRKFGVSFE